jgi:hypothetical protein
MIAHKADSPSSGTFEEDQILDCIAVSEHLSSSFAEVKTFLANRPGRKTTLPTQRLHASKAKG